jgi:hypothetical protein
MYYDLLKKITVTNFGKNDLGIYVIYMLEGLEKNLGYPADEADDILQDAIGEDFKGLEFSQYDAIAVAAVHEENLQTTCRFLQRIEMSSFDNALNN